MNIIENYIDVIAKYKQPILNAVSTKLIKCIFKNGRFYNQFIQTIFNVIILIYF